MLLFTRQDTDEASRREDAAEQSLSTEQLRRRNKEKSDAYLHRSGPAPAASLDQAMTDSEVDQVTSEQAKRISEEARRAGEDISEERLHDAKKAITRPTPVRKTQEAPAMSRAEANRYIENGFISRMEKVGGEQRMIVNPDFLSLDGQTQLSLVMALYDGSGGMSIVRNQSGAVIGRYEAQSGLTCCRDHYP